MAHQFRSLFLGVAASWMVIVQLAGAQAPDPLLQQADEALQKKDYVTAAQALETYLAKTPEDYRAEFNLAYAYSLSGRRRDAISHYKNVLARQPDLPAAQLNVGILLFEANDFAEAEPYLRTIAEREPDNVTANFYLAETLSALKRAPEASKAYERVLKDKPGDARAHFGYGKLLEQSDPAAAEEHLRRAIELDPSAEEASIHLARLLEARASASAEALREAETIYRRHLQKHPDRIRVRVTLGELYLGQKQFSAAAEQLEMARAGGDSSLPVAKALLQAYLNGGEQGSDKIIALVREIVARDDQDAEMHLLLGKLQLDRKQYRNAAAEFQRVTKLLPDSPEGYSNLASALYLTEEYDAAVTALARISELKRETAGTYFLRAICLDKLGYREAALQNYQNFLAVDQGKNPDQEFQARQRSKVLAREISKGIRRRK